MGRDGAKQIVVGQSVGILEEGLDTGTPVAETVDSSWISGLREVSWSIDAGCQSKVWGLGCWRKGSQA